MKDETFSFEDLPFEIIRRAENAMLEIRNLDGVLIGIIDTNTSAQHMTRKVLETILGDRAMVILKQLQEAGVKL